MLVMPIVANQLEELQGGARSERERGVPAVSRADAVQGVPEKVWNDVGKLQPKGALENFAVPIHSERRLRSGLKRFEKVWAELVGCLGPNSEKGLLEKASGLLSGVVSFE